MINKDCLRDSDKAARTPIRNRTEWKNTTSKFGEAKTWTETFLQEVLQMVRS
jgi:hypothetical protein